MKTITLLLASALSLSASWISNGAGGGGSSSGSLCTVAYASTLTLNWTQTGCSGYIVTLTGDVATLDFSNETTTSFTRSITFVQDGTGGHVVTAYGANIVNGCGPRAGSAAASVTTVQINYDGTNINFDGCHDVNYAATNLGSAAADPVAGVQNGDFYYNTVTLKNRMRQNGAWTDVSGGATAGTGIVALPLGYASYTAGGSSNTGVTNGGANGGITIAFQSPVTSIAYIHYKLTVAGAGGTGIAFSVTSSTFTGPCVGVGSGTDATGTGFKRVAMSGAGCSGITLGDPRILTISSDSTALKILGYGDDQGDGLINVGDSGLAKYRGAASAVTTGTGSGLTFTTLSSITWTAEGSGTDPAPYFGLEN